MSDLLAASKDNPSPRSYSGAEVAEALRYGSDYVDRAIEESALQARELREEMGEVRNLIDDAAAGWKAALSLSESALAQTQRELQDLIASNIEGGSA